MKKYWDQIEIGDSLPKLTKEPISRLQIAQFAAAADEFSPLNLDDEFAKNAGFHGVYAPGLMSLGYVEEAIKAYASNMKIFSLTGTFQRLIWPGDVLTSNGLILRRYHKNEEYRIQFSIWCENQNQEVVMKGSSICLLFKNAEHENRAKTVTPTISTSTHQSLLSRCSHLLSPDTTKVPADLRLKELV